MTAPTKTLARGGQQAAERKATEKANRKSSFDKDWDWFQLEAPSSGQTTGESIILRFVTDEPEWIEAKQHGFINTKPAPADLPEGRTWPKTMGAVCRYTLDGDGEPLYDDCYICDHVQVPGKGKLAGKMVKPFASTKLWAVAVVREAVIGTQADVDSGRISARQVGKPAYYQDALIEKEDGSKVRQYLVINQSMGNFFDKLLGFASAYGSIVDRDYKITRTGAGTDTDYTIVSLDPMKDEEGDLVDLTDPKFAEDYKPNFDLLKIVLDQAADEYYEWFFDTRVESSFEKRFGKKDEENPSPASAEAVADEPSDSEENEAQAQTNQATIEAMRARMADRGRKS